MAVPVERGPAVRGTPHPQIINAILGLWLFVSAFLWTHSQAQMTNTWIVGVLAILFSLVSMAVPWARYANTALAVWLFISAWALPTASPGTIWNNVLVAIAMFIVSLVPTGSNVTAPGPFGQRTPVRPG
jgi:hypothetical protein